MKFTSVLFSLLFFAFSLNSQINVDNTVSPETAVNDILTGIGIDAFNITFSGDSNQIGSFLSNGSNMPIGSGIILGTGNVNLASGAIFGDLDPDDQGPGGNNNGGATVGGGNFGETDDDLAILSGQTLNDAAILEFDFIATGTELTFNFVFGSEEYLEWVDSGFNDAFGFFLSGAGLNGPFDNNAVNLAVVPGTDEPVTINSINNVLNTDFFIDNSTSGTDPSFVEFDGLTTNMTAFADLVCDSVYHIKLVIADGSDTALDSGVFLEAGSFDSNAFQVIGTGAIAGTSIFEGDSIIVEGPTCNSAGFEFILPDTVLTDTTIYFNVLGTATYDPDPDIGDFTFIPDSIIIPAGSNQASLIISAFEDNEVEGFETVTIEYEYVTVCLDTITSLTTMYISDYIEPTVTTEDASVPCPGQGVILNSEVTGFGGFMYDWGDGNNEPSLSANPDETTTFTLTVTDICGTEASSDVVVTVPDFPPLTATLIEGTSTCPGDPITIGVEVEGGSPGYSYNWLVGGNQPSITVNPDITTEFTVFVTDQCETVPFVVTGTVIPWPGLDIVSLDGTSICPGEPVDIGVTVSGGFPDYTYEWSSGLGNESTTTVSPFSDTNYTITVTDQCDSQSATVSIDVDDLQQNIVVPYDTVICAGDTYAIDQELISGGLGVYSFSTFESPDSLTLTEEGVYTGLQQGFYEVIVTDACAWVFPNVLQIEVENCDTFIPNVFSPDSDGAEGSSIGGLGLNERFFIIGLDKFPNSELYVYNRWGVLVYEDSNYNNSWRGQNAAGNDLKDGIYFYVFRRSDGKEQTGSVTILREER
ncbi:MAG: choice-of-anchor L domain-containing protein [Flavobacteriales bacterium]